MLFSIALAWSWFGYVDIIATAQGNIVPSGRTKIVQPLDIGTVEEIAVQDGDRVRAGELLVRLDEATALADRNRTARDLTNAELDVARLKALSRNAKPEEVMSAFVAPEGVPREKVELSKAFAYSQATEQAAKLANLDRQIDQKASEILEIEASINKLEVVLPLLREKQEMRARLLRLEYGNRFAFLEAEQAVFEGEHDLLVQQKKMLEAKDARAALERQRDEAVAEYAHKVLSDLSDAEQKVSDQTQDLIKAQRKLAETKLFSPIDGIVQQLAIHTVGGVVTPAQQLMVIVPAGKKLIVEAMVSNQDVGFVHAGQSVQIKIETFNFTRYGLIHGHVIDVSPDSVTDRKQNTVSNDPLSSNKRVDGEDKKGSPAYVARMLLDEDGMTVDGKWRQLRPGMAVSAEIKTGSRRILDYLLSPLRQHVEEAIRER